MIGIYLTLSYSGFFSLLLMKIPLHHHQLTLNLQKRYS